MIEEILKNYAKGEVDDRELKDLGQVVRHGKDSDLYKLIQFVVENKTRSTLDAINNGVLKEDATATLHFLCGLRKVITELHQFEAVEQEINHREHQERLLSKPDYNDELEVMGLEGSDVRSPVESLSN